MQEVQLRSGYNGPTDNGAALTAVTRGVDTNAQRVHVTNDAAVANAALLSADSSDARTAESTRAYLIFESFPSCPKQGRNDVLQCLRQTSFSSTQATPEGCIFHTGIIVI
jgi:hypothetical protein